MIYTEEEIIYNNEKYTIIQVIKKKYEQQDMFICKNKFGVKFCFRRDELYPKCRVNYKKLSDPQDDRITAEDIELIKQLSLQGFRYKDIFQHSKLKNKKNLENNVQKIRRELVAQNLLVKHSTPPKINKVGQYTLNMELIAEYPSCCAAGLANRLDYRSIYKCCKGKLDKYKNYIWKFIED